MLCCAPIPPCLGNPAAEFIGDITLLLVLLRNANLCKFLTNFLFFPDGALYHLNVKFWSSWYPKDVATECLICSKHLAEAQRCEVENTSHWAFKGCTNGTHLRTKASYLREDVYWKEKAKTMLAAETTVQQDPHLRDHRKPTKALWYCQHGRYV